MAYIMTDEDFERLQEIANGVMELEKPLSLTGQHALAAAIKFVIADALHMDVANLDVLRKAQSKNEAGYEGVFVEITKQFESLLKHLTNEVGGVVVTKVNDVPWFFSDELAPELCGLIPHFLFAHDPRPLRQQIDERYSHGGGWRSMGGWRFNRKKWAIRYGDDPPLQPLGGAALNGEICVVFPDAWVMVMRDDEHFDIARLDITSEGLN